MTYIQGRYSRGHASIPKFYCRHGRTSCPTSANKNNDDGSKSYPLRTSTCSCTKIRPRLVRPTDKSRKRRRRHHRRRRRMTGNSSNFNCQRNHPLLKPTMRKSFPDKSNSFSGYHYSSFHLFQVKVIELHNHRTLTMMFRLSLLLAVLSSMVISTAAFAPGCGRF